MAGITSLQAVREVEYDKIRSKLSELKSSLSEETLQSKIAGYKLNSAIKYESHIRSEKHKELQTQLSTMCTVIPSQDK